MKTGIITTVTPTETAYTGKTSIVVTLKSGATVSAVLGQDSIRIGTIKVLPNIGLEADASVVKTESYSTTMANNFFKKTVLMF
jgi:hypothetical protein